MHFLEELNILGHQDNYKPIESFNVAKSMIKESKKTINRTKFYHFTDIMNILND